MKKLLELLTAAEAEAKRLADVDNSNSAAQVLRARVRSALEFAESPAFAAPAKGGASVPASRP
jgi:hypothetical protein